VIYAHEDIDNPYPEWKRPMDQLLTVKALRETPSLSIDNHRKRIPVPPDFSSAMKLFVVGTDGEEGEWKQLVGKVEVGQGMHGKSSGLVNSLSRLTVSKLIVRHSDPDLKLDLTLTWDQVTSIRSSIAQVLYLMPSRRGQNNSAQMDELLRKRKQEEAAEWDGWVDGVSEQIRVSYPEFDIQVEN
jgi:hypothetical protein